MSLFTKRSATESLPALAQLIAALKLTEAGGRRISRLGRLQQRATTTAPRAGSILRGKILPPRFGCARNCSDATDISPRPRKAWRRPGRPLRDPAAYTGWHGPMEEHRHHRVWTALDFSAKRERRSRRAAARANAISCRRWRLCSTATFGMTPPSSPNASSRRASCKLLSSNIRRLANASVDDWQMKLRYLLGRRLVREDRYEKAGELIPPPWDQVLKNMSPRCKPAHDQNHSKKERARAFFTAAWMARHDGMELMGTESAPDGFVMAALPDARSGAANAQRFLSGHDLLRHPNRSHEKSDRPARAGRERARLTKSKPVPGFTLSLSRHRRRPRDRCCGTFA